MNNDFVQECSQRFAQRLMNDSDNPAQRIVAAHRLAYSRDPTVDELERGLAYIDQYANGLRRAGVVEDEVEHEAWLSYARTILTANEFVYVD
jgi:hypothetical protein